VKSSKNERKETPPEVKFLTVQVGQQQSAICITMSNKFQ